MRSISVRPSATNPANTTKLNQQAAPDDPLSAEASQIVLAALNRSREVEAFAREVEGKAKVVKIDIDKSPAIAQQLRIQSVPTFMVVAEGRIQDAVVGAIRKKKMQEMLEPFFPRAAGAIKAAELAQLVAGGAVVPIDTRDAGAFGRAHLPQAVNMPIEGIESRLAELHMLAGQPVLYCRGGDKSKELSEKLTEQGMPVAFLEGGLLSWEAEGLPIER